MPTYLTVKQIHFKTEDNPKLTDDTLDSTSVFDRGNISFFFMPFSGSAGMHQACSGNCEKPSACESESRRDSRESTHRWSVLVSDGCCCHWPCCCCWPCPALPHPQLSDPFVNCEFPRSSVLPLKPAHRSPQEQVSPQGQLAWLHLYETGTLKV